MTRSTDAYAPDRIPAALLLAVLSALMSAFAGLSCSSAPAAAVPLLFETNREFEVLEPPSSSHNRRAVMAEAARELGSWGFNLAGVSIDAARLLELSGRNLDEPLVRVVREGLGRPVDIDDFLLFLDDLILAGRRGLRAGLIWVTPSRGRKSGILIHPDDVFESDKPRLYGVRGPLAVDRPQPQRNLPAARDGDTLGPNWTMRYQNPKGEEQRLQALANALGGRDFADRIRLLIRQLRDQGAQVYLNSTVRSPQRGYLMWGAFELSRRSDSKSLLKMLSRLRGFNREWNLDVPIEWMHPDGWRATRNAAREMADTYEVVYATEQGARSSFHYTATAVDLVALDLPRSLVLHAPDSATRVFDLSGADQTRDLSLSPELIDWLEIHFELEKLRADYPHWNDAKPRGSQSSAEPNISSNAVAASLS